MKQWWQECVFVKSCVYMCVHCATWKRDFGGKAIYFANWFSSFCSDSCYIDLDLFPVTKSNNVGISETHHYHYLLFILFLISLFKGRGKAMLFRNISEAHSTCLLHYGQLFLCCHSTCNFKCDAVSLHRGESAIVITNKIRSTLRNRAVTDTMTYDLVFIIVQKHDFLNIELRANNFIMPSVVTLDEGFFPHMKYSLLVIMQY